MEIGEISKVIYGWPDKFNFTPCEIEHNPPVKLNYNGGDLESWCQGFSNKEHFKYLILFDVHGNVALMINNHI